MITRADVADLQPGDVVELRYDAYPGTAIRGPVHGSKTGSLSVLFLVIRDADGPPALGDDLTVVSRAPRPLYVNHDRTEPVPGDVVRDADDDTPVDVWVRTWGALPDRWAFANGGAIYDDAEMPKSLRLLVDGETGMPPAVQS